MNISVAQIQSHLDRLTALQSQYATLSTQSVEKFDKIIATAKVYQDKMTPLNKGMEHLQVQQRNITACFEKLNRIQEYRKSARDIGTKIEQGPSGCLATYLKLLDSLQETYAFFISNQFESSEAITIQAIFNSGLKKLNQEFASSLRLSFRLLNVEQLLKLSEAQLEDSADTLSFDDIASLEACVEVYMENMRSVVHWMRVSKSDAGSSSLHNSDNVRVCVQHYQEHRRDTLRDGISRLRSLLKEQDAPGTAAKKSGAQKARTKRPYFIWDVNARRQVDETETEDLNVDHYCISLFAFVILIKNEQRWMSRVEIMPDESDVIVALDMILKVTSNELIGEAGHLVRYMQNAEKHADFSMILSLMYTCRCIGYLAVDMMYALQGLHHIITEFNSITFKLLNQIDATLRAFVEFFRHTPEHYLSSRVQVPPDGTVHELTTNALMFLENILEFPDVLSAVFAIKSLGPIGSSNVLKFLGKHLRDKKEMSRDIGRFLLNALTALISKLEGVSTSYSSEPIQFLFLMNNLQYIMKTIHKTDVHQYILNENPEGIAGINSILTERRGQYSRSVAVYLTLHQSDHNSSFPGSLKRRATQFGNALALMMSPTMNNTRSALSHHRYSISSTVSVDRLSTNSSDSKMDSKERAAIKAMWNDFNAGMNLVIRSHSIITVPDPDLRDLLTRTLQNDLVPLYDIFLKQCSEVPFTTHREKYIRYTKEAFETCLKQLFIATPGR